MARVDLMLLTSDIPYIIGLHSDMIKNVKYSLSIHVVIFDIDSKEIFKNRREFIQATESEVLFSAEISAINEESFWELPTWLYLPKLKELETRIREFPKSNSEHKFKAYVNKIREYYFKFFIHDLLDIK